METIAQQPEPPVSTLPEPGEEQQATLSQPDEKTPQQFYAEVTEREDVRVILQELAGA